MDLGGPFSLFSPTREKWQGWIYTVTFYRNKADEAKKATQVHLTPIPRPSTPAKMTVEEAVEADRRYFAEHPDQDEYIREFCPGEFGAAELPDIPAGFRYATVVTVIHRTDGVVDGRHRRMIATHPDPTMGRFSKEE